MGQLKLKKFDLVEFAVILLFGGVLVFALTRTPTPVTDEVDLAATYGPDHYSESEEEWIIRDFFQDRRNGVFLDVGAGHYVSNSNTVYLERVLGWSGLAVEALSHFSEGYREHRPRTRFLAYFVSDVSDERVKMFTLGETFAGSSSDPDFVRRFGDHPQEVVVPSITLNDLLAQEQVDRFDFMSMDIELSEPKALAGFDIERFLPALVCIEAHPEVRQRILDYFALHGYVLLGKYLRIDSKNLYFTPLPVADGQPPRA